MLGGPKLYKTKLCVLYRKGNCSRANCNFAHGEAELRRFSGGSSSFNGRRDYRSGDLRNKLDKRYSPHRRYSPGRDARSHHPFHAQKPLSRDRGNSHPWSPGRRSERGYRRKQHVGGESDDSESLKISDGTEDLKKEDKVSTYEKKYNFEEKLKQIQSEIERLEDDKSQLQNYLEEKITEEHKLSNRIEDLEIQLNKEQEDCKRITSKIKKYVRAHGRYLKAQEELKRSQARLQGVGDQLGPDISKPGANEEDSSINIPCDVEPNGGNRRSPSNDELKNNALSVKKRPYVSSATSEEARVGSSQKRKGFSGLITKSEKASRSEGPDSQSENDKKETESKKMIQNKKEVNMSLSEDYKHRQGKNNNSSFVTLDKVKGSDAGRARPSTSFAAHAVDELIEAIETEGRFEAMEGTAAYENGVINNKASSSYMPPPPPPPQIDLNAYRQHEGNDEEVDVERVDSEMFGIDLNDEVEIE